MASGLKTEEAVTLGRSAVVPQTVPTAASLWGGSDGPLAAVDSQAKSPGWFASLASACCSCLPCLASSHPTPTSSTPTEKIVSQQPIQRELLPTAPEAASVHPIDHPNREPRSSLPERQADLTISPPSLPLPSPLPPEPPTELIPVVNMAERALQQILTQLRSNPSMAYGEAAPLLSKAKMALLQLKALTPTPSTPSHLLPVARDVYEHGALLSIRARNPEAFTRYVTQLQPFYEMPPSALKPNPESQNKVTGLYLLLMLTQGRYSEFHSELEGLSTRADGSDAGIEGDRYLGYPIKLERWLMEGSYDRVWKAMKKGEVPSEEYGVFSEILTSQIRLEIASSSERAYPSLPLSSTKSLLFLDSEGAVVEFARERGWSVRDGVIYFPAADAGDGEAKDLSQMVIENTLGYTRELETIV